MTGFTTIKEAITQVRNFRTFDPTAFRDALLDRALEVYRTGKDTEDTQRASRIAELDGISFKQALLAILDAKVADKVQRQQGKELPYIGCIEANQADIFAQAEAALKAHGLVWQQGRKCKAPVDEYSKLWQACTVIEALEALDEFPDEITVYGLRIGIGNSIYVSQEVE